MEPLASRSCRVCGGRTEPAVIATERMFGMGGEFAYDRCADCGCVLLREVPATLPAYYAADYYAFAEPEAPRPLRQAYRRVRDSMLFGRVRYLRPMLAPFLPRRVLEVGEWFARAGVSRDARLLDVGCGVGLLLRRLVDEGYRYATGIDPFIAEDIQYRGRTLVRRATLDQVEGTYDLIMFHHSLEHIEDQRGTMDTVARLLVPSGCCIVRVPTVSSAAWERYQDRWVQLDAPRHLVLHSVQSLETLARRAGLRLERVVYDSTGFQFEGSELYRRDATLRELDGPAFSRWQRWMFALRARRLNAQGRGDQAAFYLRKP